MGAFLTLAFLVLVGPLSIWLGADLAGRATAAGSARVVFYRTPPPRTSGRSTRGRPAGP